MPPKSYRPWSPYQSDLLPQSPSQWLPEDHLAYFVLEVVQELDLSNALAQLAPGRVQAAGPAGRQPERGLRRTPS